MGLPTAASKPIKRESIDKGHGTTPRTRSAVLNSDLAEILHQKKEARSCYFKCKIKQEKLRLCLYIVK